MFIRGNFKLKTIYWNNRKELIIINTIKPKEFHTHISFDRRKAAEMIVIRAYKGIIPDTYPNWMIKSINRLWYGKNTEKMDLIYEEPKEQIIKKQKSHNKKQRYKNNPRR